MGAAAVAAKVASAVLSSEKGRKTAGTIILVVLVVALTPILAIAALFSSGFSFDSSGLAAQVAAQMSSEDQARIEAINAEGVAIENAMREAGFGSRSTEAEVLFLLALSDHLGEEDFVSRLVGCFAADQTDAQLIAAVNAEFGTSISVEDFSHVMDGVRAVYIDTSRYVSPTTKNNLDLVQFAKEAEHTGWGYVWGTYGKILTEALFEAKLDSTLTISTSMKNSSGRTGSANELRIALDSSRPMAGSILRPMRSSMGPTICRMWEQTPCTTLQWRKAPSTPSRKSPA